MTLLEYYWHIRGQEDYYDRELRAGWEALVYQLEGILDIPLELRL